MESETSAVIGVECVGLEPNEAGLYQPIVTHNTAATAPGEPTAVVESPLDLSYQSADEAGSAIYTLLQVEGAEAAASSYGDNVADISTGFSPDQLNTVSGSETISIPILSSTVIGSTVTSYNDCGPTRVLLMRTDTGETIGLQEADIWVQQTNNNNNVIPNPSDITREAFITSTLPDDEMGTDMITDVNSDTPEFGLSCGTDQPMDVRICIDNKADYGHDDKEEVGEIHIVDVVDDDIDDDGDEINARPDSTMTIDSESSSAISSSESSFSTSYHRQTSNNCVSMTTTHNSSINGYVSGDDDDISGNKIRPNRTPICSDSFMPIRTPPPITRITTLPNLPGIRGTSLAATKPVSTTKSKVLDSLPHRRRRRLSTSRSRVSSSENGNSSNSGPISHSVSSMLLKQNESVDNDISPIRPVPQVRPCFSAFGLNPQLLPPSFHFPPLPPPPHIPHIPLPPLTVFATPLRVVPPSFSLPHHGDGVTSVPPFVSTSCPSTVGLRGTLPGNLPHHVRLIPPPFATGRHSHPYQHVESRRIVRRRRNSAANNTNSTKPSDSSEDPESQKVRRRQANARERDRVTYLNSGFEQLRRVLPWVQHGRRISKVDTLRAAISYIDHLQRILWDADHASYLSRAPVTIGPSSLTTDICKLFDFRPTFGILPPPPTMCIGTAERRDIERSRLVISEDSIIKSSPHVMISENNPTLRWLSEFQETLRRLPKPIQPSHASSADRSRVIRPGDIASSRTRPRIVVVENNSV